MRCNGQSRRLILLLLDGSPAPAGFGRFEGMPNPKVSLELVADGTEANAVDVLRAALPDLIRIDNDPESSRAQELIRKTITAPRPKSLTIVIGPYASAEIDKS